MDTDEAVSICRGWFDYLKREEAKTKRMQELAAMARKGPDEAREARKELRKIDQQPKVYDGSRLHEAVQHLVALAEN